MEAVSYQREKQFTGEIEDHIGILNEAMTKKYIGVKIYNPIIDGVLWHGICHTNAKNVVEIDVNYPVKDSITGIQIN